MSIETNIHIVQSVQANYPSQEGKQEVNQNIVSSNNNKIENDGLGNSLTAKEKEEVAKLKKIDRKVRTHENAHKAAAGELATGGPNYNYKTGPDNKRYAVGGHVNIDTSKVPNDPEATIKKAQKVRKAALAPVDPSAQDLKVAAEAKQMETTAKAELLKETTKENKVSSNLDEKVKTTYNQKDDATFDLNLKL